MTMFHLQAEPTECTIVFPIISSKPVFESASEPSSRDMDWRPGTVPAMSILVVGGYLQPSREVEALINAWFDVQLGHDCDSQSPRSPRWYLLFPLTRMRLVNGKETILAMYRQQLSF